MNNQTFSGLPPVDYASVGSPNSISSNVTETETNTTLVLVCLLVFSLFVVGAGSAIVYLIHRTNQENADRGVIGGHSAATNEHILRAVEEYLCGRPMDDSTIGSSDEEEEFDPMDIEAGAHQKTENPAPKEVVVVGGE